MLSKYVWDNNAQEIICAMAYSIFYPYRVMNDKTQYVLERMVARLPWNGILVNLIPQKKISEKKNSVFHPEKDWADLPPIKIYLETETPRKNYNQGIPWIFTSIPLYG